MNNKRIISVLSIVIILILILLPSCSNTTPIPTDTPVPKTSAPTIELTTIAATPIPQTHTPTVIPPTPTRTPLPPSITSEFPVGKYYHKHDDGSHCVFQFNADKTFEYYWLIPSLDVTNWKPFMTGIYSTDGSTYSEVSNEMFPCKWAAIYAWTFDGEILLFQVIGEDRCKDRQRTYEKLPWYKAE